MLILRASSPGALGNISGKLRQSSRGRCGGRERGGHGWGPRGRRAWAARDPSRVIGLGPVGPLPKWAELPGKEGTASGVLTERFPTSSLNMPSQRPPRRAVKQNHNSLLPGLWRNTWSQNMRKLYDHFTVRETEVQRSGVTCLISNRWSRREGL